jgi:hypothetical protein
MVNESIPSDWKECRDEKYGFSFYYPPDWYSTTPEGSCVQLQKGESNLPHGVPEVDVFLSVRPRDGKFPEDYLISALSRGVKYTDRRELTIGTLPAVRARFESLGGPESNWGVEYAVCKGESVLRIYISQPKRDVERQFDAVVSNLRW